MPSRLWGPPEVNFVGVGMCEGRKVRGTALLLGSPLKSRSGAEEEGAGRPPARRPPPQVAGVGLTPSQEHRVEGTGAGPTGRVLTVPAERPDGLL